MSFSFFLFFLEVWDGTRALLWLLAMTFGETGDSALFIDLSVCSVWRVVKSEVCLVYFFFCPHKMKGLNAKVHRTPESFPLGLLELWWRRGVPSVSETRRGVGRVRAVCFRCIYVMSYANKDVVYRCKSALFGWPVPWQFILRWILGQ